MNKRKIVTNAFKRLEVFNILALGEATQLPILLVGPPGVSKTQCVIDYTHAPVVSDTAHHVTDSEITAGPSGPSTISESFEQSSYDPTKVFVLETDAESRAVEIKGRVDIESLAVSHRFALDVPAAKAEAIVINEIDKASGSLRSSLLGVMNERKIMNGRFLFDCNWKLFVGTCNEIPVDEIKSPLWDRFVIKYQVNRLSATDLLTYFSQGGRRRRSTIVVNVPSVEEIDAVELDADRYEKFLSVAYEKLTDRTHTMVEKIVKAISLIWECPIDMALVKAAELLLSKEVAHTLSKALMSPHVKQITEQMRFLEFTDNEQDFFTRLGDIEKLVTKFASEGKLTQSELNYLAKAISDILEESPFYKKGAQGEEALAASA